MWKKEPPTAEEVAARPLWWCRAPLPPTLRTLAALGCELARAEARGIAGAALASARDAAREVAGVTLTYGAAVVVGLAIEAVAWIEERARPA